MSKPVWTTFAGHLGTIQENEYYSLPVIATAGGSDIVYTLIAGSLPPGLLIRRDGVIEGQPTTKVDVAGIPQEVGQDVTNTFAVRATADNIVTDRTFSLTVTGQDAPVFITASGDLGTFIDGEVVTIQLTAQDPDPDDTYTFTQIAGELPPGITLQLQVTLRLLIQTLRFLVKALTLQMILKLVIQFHLQMTLVQH